MVKVNNGGTRSVFIAEFELSFVCEVFSRKTIVGIGIQQDGKSAKCSILKFCEKTNFWKKCSLPPSPFSRSSNHFRIKGWRILKYVLVWWSVLAQSMEETHDSCFAKKLFWKCLENSQENVSDGLQFFQKLHCRGYLRKFAKSFRTVIFSVQFQIVGPLFLKAPQYAIRCHSSNFLTVR